MGGRWKLAAVVAASMAILASVPAPGAAQGEPVVVALLDSGIYAQHETFLPNQVVAWYDFTLDGGPDVPSTTWDARIDPYDNDDNGHGTIVAAMVGGTGEPQTPSHAPGVSLAVGKVQNGGRTQTDDLARAIVWATDVVGADIISISQWWASPYVGAARPILEAISQAREAGVLVVVLAGNSVNHSWLHAPATSTDALVVGGAWAAPSRLLGLVDIPDGTPTPPLSSWDPEVTSRFFVKPPTTGCSSCYSSHSSQGTSYATPLVAGMAASLLESSRGAGLPDPSPDRMESLLKWAARDAPEYPAVMEGYGYLDAPELELAREHLLAGTTPNQNDPVKQTSAAWVELVQPPLRSLGAGDVPLAQ